MNKIFKTKIFPFLRIEVEGAAEVYYLQGSDFLLILGGLETRIIISRLNFHIFEFFHRGLLFWDSFDKSFMGLPEGEFGPTLQITTAS